MRIAIIGAGAAGCFAAANMPEDGHEVVIFEKTGKVLQKVKVSGGGRCNVTHACYKVPELIEKYPRGKQLLRKTLYAFNPSATVSWFEDRGIQIKEEEDGRMFPVTDNSQTIIDCLLNELKRKNISIKLHKSVERIEKHESGLIVHFADKTQYIADRVLIAAGGYPKKEQYHWLTELGHTIQEPVPSLFTFNLPAGKAGRPKPPITELMGVVIQDVTVKIAGTKIAESGPLLITHWGLSGPAILRTSAWAARELSTKHYEFTIHINWLNGITETELRNKLTSIRRTIGKQQVWNKKPFQLPRRFWEYQMQVIGIDPETKWGDLSSAHQIRLVDVLVADNYEIKGKTTFKEEFVTCGGIQLSEVNPQSMESRIVSGLFFAGEILDVDGITGGFNFQHAWASGYIASQFITH